jgi:hypothetical protein
VIGVLGFWGFGEFQMCSVVGNVEDGKIYQNQPLTKIPSGCCVVNAIQRQNYNMLLEKLISNKK